MCYVLEKETGMAALSQYLTKRSNSQFYQLRRMVPTPIRSIIGKREFYRSLRVTERRIAEQLAFPILSAWECPSSEHLALMAA